MLQAPTELQFVHWFIRQGKQFTPLFEGKNPILQVWQVVFCTPQTWQFMTGQEVHVPFRIEYPDKQVWQVLVALHIEQFVTEHSVHAPDINENPDAQTMQKLGALQVWQFSMKQK